MRHVMGTYPYSRPVTLTEALLGAVGRSEPTVCVLPLSTDTSLSLILGAEHESRIGGVQKSQPLELHGDSR